MSWFNHSSSFEASVTPELSMLYRVARRMGCTAEEAEDIIQQTLVKAYQAWSRFDGRHLRSWLIRILRNERLMALRKGQPDLSLDDDESDLQTGEVDFWHRIADRIQAQQIREAIDRLPDTYRLTIHLCDVEQLSYEEVAESLSVPVGTVRSRLFRARGMIRRSLASVFEEATS